MTAVAVLLSDTAAARAIDDIRLSRLAGVSTADLELGCPMRYLDHVPQIGGTELRIRVALDPQCKLALSGVLNELYRPESRHLAYIAEIEFDSGAPEQAIIILRFERPVSFRVNQGANFNALRIKVDTAIPVESQPLPPLPEPELTAPELPAPKAGDRRPIRLVPPRGRLSTDLFSIRLASLEPQEDIDPTRLGRFGSFTLYTSEVTVSGQQWKALSVGFFSTEEEARAELRRIIHEFPDAWIGVASAEEQASAQDNRLAVSAGIDEQAALPNKEEKPQSASVFSGTAMPDERIAELMAEAKSAMLAEDYDRSVKIYTRLLEEPEGEHRRQAREYLGVAREKRGQLAHAKAEYEAYLAEFPDDADGVRVRQRLAALAVTPQAREDTFREARDRDAAEWNVYGAASQFYLRGVNRRGEGEEEVVSQSAVLSQGDLLLSRRGKSVDLTGRINMAYLYDLMDEPTGRGDQALISFAYVDLEAHNLNFSTRIGRQTRYKGGVLGRFDGAHFSYAWRPNLAINFTAGYPVDSPWYEPNTRRYFYGGSIELTNVADAWDFSVFSQLGEVDGISDREAIGAEAQYHRGRWHLVGLVDYDTSYAALNTALFVGNWRASDRLTLNARVDVGAYPFFATSNALIGQPVNTIEALLQTFTEPQIRRIARHRTDVETQNASLGVSAALSQRFQLNADIGFRDNNGTVASAGVMAIPDMGPHYYYSANFIGSSLLKSRDTVIFGLRHSSAETYQLSTVILDMRFPFGGKLRFNPRLAVSLRDARDNTEQWILSPMLRLLYRWSRRYRVELEVGGQLWSRELPPELLTPLMNDTEQTSTYYMSLGYWMDF